MTCACATQNLTFTLVCCSCIWSCICSCNCFEFVDICFMCQLICFCLLVCLVMWLCFVFIMFSVFDRIKMHYLSFWLIFAFRLLSEIRLAYFTILLFIFSFNLGVYPFLHTVDVWFVFSLICHLMHQISGDKERTIHGHAMRHSILWTKSAFIYHLKFSMRDTIIVWVESFI